MSKLVSKEWFVYILECADGSLYTGITTDISRRFKEHTEGKRGAKYTKGHKAVRVMYSEKAENRSEASKREWQLKQLPHAQKSGLGK